MKKLLTILSVVLFANQASASSHSWAHEVAEKILMKGEIIYTAPLADRSGLSRGNGAIYHIRLRDGLVEEAHSGIYMCRVYQSGSRNIFYICEKAKYDDY